MSAGAGDCDDHARLLYALALAGGVPAKLLFFTEDDEQPVHVVTQLQDSRGWNWAETTIDAEYGEEPFDALERLNPDDASNPLAGRTGNDGLGFLGLDFVTPGDVATRKTQLDATVTSLDGDAVGCPALDTPTLSSWNEFVAAWREFYAVEPSFWNAGGQARQATDYADQIRTWQTKIAAVCKLSAPLVATPPKDPIVGAITAAAIAVGVAAAAWTFAPAIRTALSRGRP
jgi:hypothetical protein